MDEHLTFLRAVAANPADDLPRLVYADFLEETGEPDSIARAHFIRAQIALTQLVPETPEYRETEALQDRLLEMYRDVWIWDVPADMHSEGRPVWRRGFIEFLRLPWQRFIEATEMFSTVPITRVQITAARHGPMSAVSIDAAPHVRRITHLHLDRLHSIGMNGILPRYPGLLDIFVRSQTFVGLTHLDFSGSSIDTARLVEFILQLDETAWATSLKELDLSDIPALGDAVGSTLATARGLESLDRLILKRTELSEPVRAMLRRRFGERVVF